jgi:hypothetical protein
MPDVYRRSELARWQLLLSLPLGVVSLAVLLAAGVSVDFVALAIFVILAPAVSLVWVRRVADREPAERDGVLATPAAARARVVRTALLWVVPSTAVLALVSAAIGDWWVLPGSYLMTAATSAIEWRGVTAWEHAHPGAYLVSTAAHWRPQRFALRPQS